MSASRSDAEAVRSPVPLPRSRPSRVVIEPVAPLVDDGRFPAKASLGEPIEVLADVFADGHDHVAAAAWFRHDDDDAWHEVPMVPLGNDRFRATFLPDRTGPWHIDVRGWVDHFDTRRAGILAKVAAGLDVSVEIDGLLDLVDTMRAGASAADDRRLAALAVACAQGDPSVLDDPDLVALSWRTHPRTPDLGLHRSLVAFVDRDRARHSAWYELFPRSAGPAGAHGTLRDVIGRLDRISAMGFDVVYLPPVHPIGTTHRKGRNNSLTPEPDDVGSPWAIGAPEGGHTAVHPALGTVDDVEALAAACAERDMDLALDLAFQCSPDHPWVTAHPQWFAHRSDGSIQYAENPPKKYQDIYPIDFESEDWEALWHALHGVVRFWADRGVRVFRVDNPHTKAFAFWEWLMASFRATDPDVVFLAEAFTRPRVMERLGKLGFHQSYTYFTWRTDPEELRRYFVELTERTSDFMRPNPWPNTPDILHAQLQHGGRSAFVVRAVLASMLAANWGVYGPAFELLEGRAVREGSEEYLDSEKYQIRSWDLDRDDSIAPLLSRLNHIRRSLPALQYDRTLRFHRCDDPAMLAWSKTDPTGRGEPVLVVVAADPGRDAAGMVDVDWTQLGLDPDGDYELVDHLGDGRYRWAGARNYAELSPTGLPAHVFTVTGRPGARPYTPPFDRPKGIS